MTEDSLTPKASHAPLFGGFQHELEPFRQSLRSPRQDHGQGHFCKGFVVARDGIGSRPSEWWFFDSRAQVSVLIMPS